MDEYGKGGGGVAGAKKIVCKNLIEHPTQGALDAERPPMDGIQDRLQERCITTKVADEQSGDPENQERRAQDSRTRKGPLHFPPEKSGKTRIGDR